MEDNLLEIQLFPDYDSTAKDHGFDPDNDDAFGEAIGYMQGYNIKILTVEPGSDFTISSDYEYGSIESDDVKYKLIIRDSEDEFDTIEEGDSFFLDPGEYLFHEDGVTIEKLSK